MCQELSVVLLYMKGEEKLLQDLRAHHDVVYRCVSRTRTYGSRYQVSRSGYRFVGHVITWRGVYCRYPRIDRTSDKAQRDQIDEHT